MKTRRKVFIGSIKSVGLFAIPVLFCLAPNLTRALSAESGDQGNGFYRNPILFSDYSDPDVIRVGDTYYLVASSFHFMPGVPVLESHDLVNWQIISHVFPRLDIDPRYSMIGGNRYAQGAWAPSIRFHDGRFYVYFPTPEEGIFMSSAPSPRGPWTTPIAVLPGPGYEDPCPFWDDDGTAYLIHSRVGAGPLILHRMRPDGTKVLDEGKTIIDDHATLPTLEGPKLYKRDGYYYIFAPYGGVATGSQAVLRSKNIYGPYESRTVLEQGATAVRGPHQGGYVETPSGEGWFLHFSQHGGYGRILYLEPVHWKDGWPVIGSPIKDKVAGEPVERWPKPKTGRKDSAGRPSMSDDFNTRELSSQWEWNHNPDDRNWSLTERPGFLRLKALPAPDLLHARNTLTEQMQYQNFDLTTQIDVSAMRSGQRAGLVMFGTHPSWIGIVQTDRSRQIVYGDKEGESVIGDLTCNVIQLRMHIEDQNVAFSYSIDGGASFLPVRAATPFSFSWWKASRPALFTFNTLSKGPFGSIDVDWVRSAPSGTRTPDGGKQMTAAQP
jgi:beta-xylosidase